MYFTKTTSTNASHGFSLISAHGLGRVSSDSRLGLASGLRECPEEEGSLLRH